MDGASAASIHFRGAKGMKHLMINDKLEKIKRDLRIVQNRVDPDLPGMVVERTKSDGAKPSYS